MKVVINRSWGCFGLSEEAEKWLNLNDPDYQMTNYDSAHNRANKYLVQCVETLGDKVNGRFAELHIVEIPDDMAGKYIIYNNDGIESIHEIHQVWC